MDGRKKTPGAAGYSGDIAIVGMACRFPDAENYNAFWDNLKSGRISIRKHFGTSRINGKKRDTDNEYYCAALENIDRFDNAFFGISPREARCMDPQQRIMLEETWHCIEDSGIPVEKLQKCRTGVVTGVTGSDYTVLAGADPESIDSYSALGNFECVISNRVSHVFGLTGASISIDTACASSLVVVNEAEKMLKSGECDYVLAGGVCLAFHPWRYQSFSKSNMVSPDGRCRAFDACANGFVQGEGAGVILMKRLDDAVRDRNHVYAVVKGSAVGHNGASKTLAAPSVTAQSDTILRAVEDSGVPAETITYIETHGTGTSLGDPIEVEALTRVMRNFTRRKRFCHIGSVKPNIGHLASASGIASIIKCILMMKNRTIVKSLNVVEPNPLISWDDSPFVLSGETIPWRAEHMPFRAGVSAFGFGGMNAHVILESYSDAVNREEPDKTDSPMIFALSANTLDSLKKTAEDWVHSIDSGNCAEYSVHNICATVTIGRKPMGLRAGTLVQSLEDIKRFTAGLAAHPCGGPEAKYALLFGNELFSGFPVLKEASRLPGFSETVRNVLAKTGKAKSAAGFEREEWPESDRELFTFAAKYALADAYLKLGFAPECFAYEGRGLGPAAALSGLLEPGAAFAALNGGLANGRKTGLKLPKIPFYDNATGTTIKSAYIAVNELIKIRTVEKSSFADAADHYLFKAQLLIKNQYTFKRQIEEWNRAFAPYGMDIKAIISNYGDRQEIADRQLFAAMTAAAASITKINLKWQLTDTFEIKDRSVRLVLALAACDVLGKPQAAQLILSDMAADTIGQDVNKALTERKTPEVLRKFLAGRAAEPGHSLREMASAGFGGVNGCLTVSAGSSDESGYIPLLRCSESLLKIWLGGQNIHWGESLPENSYANCPLPTYAFEKIPFWLETSVPVSNAAKTVIGPMVDENVSNLDEVVYRKNLHKSEFFVGDHVVDGRVIFPGVGYIELARAAGSLALGKSVTEIDDIVWIKPIVFESESVETFIRFTLRGEFAVFDVFTLDRGARDIHCTGKIRRNPENTRPAERFDLKTLIDESLCALEKDEIYKTVFSESIGFDYGPGFQVTAKAYGGRDYAVEKLRLPEHLQSGFPDYGLHPSITDAALRTVTWIGGRDTYKELTLCIPFSLSKVEILGPTGMECYACARKVPGKNSAAELNKYNVSIVGPNGEETVRFSAFNIRPLKNKKQRNEKKIAHSCFAYAPDYNKVNTVYRSEKFAAVAVNAAAAELYGDKATVYGDTVGKNPVASPGALSGSMLAVYRLADDGTDWRANIEQLISFMKRVIQASDGRVRTLCVCEFAEPFKHPRMRMLSAFNAAFAHDAPKAEFALLATGGAAATPELIDKAANLAENINGREFLLRDGQLLERTFKDFDPISAQNRASVFKSSGVYLLSGGAGALGLKLARRLTLKYNAKVVICGRNAPTGDRADVINQLRAGGADIHFIKADITDLAQTKNAVTFTVKKFGCIDGVVNCAGYLPSKKLFDMDTSEIARAMSAKIAGTENLDAATADLGLDFFAMFSSVASVLGDFGRGAYAMASCFMDCFAEYRELLTAEGKRRGKSLSIGWPFWKDGGMKFVNEEQDVYRELSGLELLETGEGLDLFEKLLSAARGRITAAVGDKAAVDRIMHIHRDKPALTAQNTGDSAKKQFIADLSRMVAEVTGVDTDAIAPDTEFSEYGVDSIMIMDLNRQLEKRLGEIPQTLFFEYNTISSLSAYLFGEYSDRICETAVGPVEKAENDAQGVPVVSTGYKSTDAKERLIADLTNIISAVTGVPVDAVTPETEFSEYGVDSIMIMDLNHQLEKRLGEIPQTLFFEYSTVESLAGHLAEEYGDRLEAAKLPVTSGTPQVYRPSALQLPDKASVYVEGKVSACNHADEGIAVIGLSGRYPGANTLQELWNVLIHKKDCITEVPADRWDCNEYFDPKVGAGDKVYCKWGGFIDDVDKFDPVFFNISPREAQRMDPQERLFLQCAYHTVEDAAMNPDALSGKNVGVFAGAMNSHYQMYAAEEYRKGRLIDLRSSFASIANRVSYCLNLKGPSLTADTMCSSSLTAIHYACESIHRGECEMAIAGGVNAILHPAKYVFLSENRFGSTDGQCRAFCEGGTGYVPGEGVGAVLLKPLSKAVADNDRIYAVIKGSAINHGGRTNSYTVPDPNAQREVILSAMCKAGVSAADLGYIEAHGTGTALGDPIEITGLTEAFKKYTDKKQFCPIGSIKSNIGHLESAAGIASLTKVLLQFQHKTLAPTRFFGAVNPNIKFEKTPFRLQTEPADWEQPYENVDGVRRALPRSAGVSSFGAGGTNVHVIVQEYIESHAENRSFLEPAVIPLSAKDFDRLSAVAGELLRALEHDGGPQLHDIAYTLQTGRKQFPVRFAVVAGSVEELKAALGHFCETGVPGKGAYLNADGSANGNGLFDADYLSEILEKKQYDRLARIWILGEQLDWDRLYTGNRPSKISLPGYPFYRNRYWVEKFPDLPVSEIQEIKASEKQTALETAASLEDTKDLTGGMTDDVAAIIGNVLHLSREMLAPETPFEDYGADSALNMEIVSRINEKFGTDIEATDMYSYPTLNALSGFIYGKTDRSGRTRKAEADAPVQERSGEEMSGAEFMELLNEVENGDCRDIGRILKGDQDNAE